MCTTTERGGRFGALALGLAIALVGIPVQAAGPEGEPSTTTTTTTSTSTSTGAPAAGPATVEGALEAGDLDAATELAKTQREADPSPENWRTEAEVAERRGDLAAAEAAYRGELKALPDEGATVARERAQADLARLRAEARGTVPGEPASKHREDIDAKWAPAKKPATAKKRRTVPPPAPRRAEDRIVTKWYFWVTVGAIAASAAAVTAIAIRAARDDEPDALGLEAGPRSMGPALLRF